MKATKIIYWTTTILIFIFEGVMPALTSNTEMAKQGISHLGYPAYFGIMLTVFKVLGALGLLLPMVKGRVKGRVKEWVYAGFAFDFIFAAGSHWAVDGFGGMALFPVLVLGVLVVSYITYHKIQNGIMNVQPKTTQKNTIVYQ